jgi:thiol-disulfide isomerase/thioredoxin
MRLRLYLLAILASLTASNVMAAEEDELRIAITGAGSDPAKLARAIEDHLAKYPDSRHAAELERIGLKAATETRDHPRVVMFGERVLARESGDVAVLELVARGLLASDDAEAARKALSYARRLEVTAPKSLGRALIFQARAKGNLGEVDEAIVLARRSFEAAPAADAARESAKWLERAGRMDEALVALANAVAISDPRSTDAQRAADRIRLGDMYRRVHGSEDGLSDLILAAHGRMMAVTPSKPAPLRPLDFTLAGLDGPSLTLNSLKGKVIVLDFWATWCGPCRAQKPLYDRVEQRFKGRADVVFLAINTNEDRSLVKSFMNANGWSQRSVYFAGPLASALRIHSIPTTVVIDRRGEIASRLDGFIPQRFVEMLTESIARALAR